MIHFFCPGRPQAQGSKISTKWGMREANKELGPWRERVALAAHAAADGHIYPTGVPVAVGLEFVLYRPASAPKTKTPPATKKPDIDKMERGILDALTHVLWADDAQVTHVFKFKRVAALEESPGVHVWVTEA
jgi:crossover junction endodeoxyribonuclease RusA